MFPRCHATCTAFSSFYRISRFIAFEANSTAKPQLQGYKFVYTHFESKYTGKPLFRIENALRKAPEVSKHTLTLNSLMSGSETHSPDCSVRLEASDLQLRLSLNEERQIYRLLCLVTWQIYRLLCLVTWQIYRLLCLVTWQIYRLLCLVTWQICVI